MGSRDFRLCHLPVDPDPTELEVQCSTEQSQVTNGCKGLTTETGFFTLNNFNFFLNQYMQYIIYMPGICIRAAPKVI